jgi:hypothetical protein
VSIPRIIVGTTTVPDLSRVDWDKTINVAGKQVALSSSTALQALNIPDDIKNIVSEYRSDMATINSEATSSPAEKATEKIDLKQALHHIIAEKLIAQGALPANYFKLEANGMIQTTDHIVDVTKASINQLSLVHGNGVRSMSNIHVASTTTSTVITSPAIAPPENVTSARASSDVSSSDDDMTNVSSSVLAAIAALAQEAPTQRAVEQSSMSRNFAMDDSFSGPYFKKDTDGTLMTDLVSYYPMEDNSNDFYGTNDGADTAISYGTSYGLIGQGANLTSATRK